MKIISLFLIIMTLNAQIELSRDPKKCTQNVKDMIDKVFEAILEIYDKKFNPKKEIFTAITHSV